jgi:hypothetical protein
MSYRLILCCVCVSRVMLCVHPPLLCWSYVHFWLHSLHIHMSVEWQLAAAQWLVIGCIQTSGAMNLILVNLLSENAFFNVIQVLKSHATHIKIFSDGCSSVPVDWFNKHMMLLWLYKSPHRSHHVVTCLWQSISCLSTVKVQACLFHKCNSCSFSNTTWYLNLV